MLWLFPMNMLLKLYGKEKRIVTNAFPGQAAVDIKLSLGNITKILKTGDNLFES